MPPSPRSPALASLSPGQLRRIHHLALNVKDMQASRRFYGGLLGLKELTGDAVDDTLKDLVATGKVANFVTLTPIQRNPLPVPITWPLTLTRPSLTRPWRCWRRIPWRSPMAR